MAYCEINVGVLKEGFKIGNQLADSTVGRYAV